MMQYVNTQGQGAGGDITVASHTCRYRHSACLQKSAVCADWCLEPVYRFNFFACVMDQCRTLLHALSCQRMQNQHYCPLSSIDFQQSLSLLLTLVMLSESLRTRPRPSVHQQHRDRRSVQRNLGRTIPMYRASQGLACLLPRLTRPVAP